MLLDTSVFIFFLICAHLNIFHQGETPFRILCRWAL